LCFLWQVWNASDERRGRWAPIDIPDWKAAVFSWMIPKLLWHGGSRGQYGPGPQPDFGGLVPRLTVSQGCRSNFRKLFAEKPAKVARINKKKFPRYAPNSYVVYHIFLVLFYLAFLRCLNRDILCMSCFNPSRNTKKYLNRWSWQRAVLGSSTVKYRKWIPPQQLMDWREADGVVAQGPCLIMGSNLPILVKTFELLICCGSMLKRFNCYRH
jgi:hypothetical protein